MSQDSRDVPAAAVDEPDLRKFQLRILAILAAEPQYGLSIKRDLEEYYGELVNHGRLYSNLDELIEAGLVEKSELDKRTNEYALTDAGRQALLGDLQWQVDQFGLDLVPPGEQFTAAQEAGD